MQNPFLEGQSQLRKEWKAFRNTLTSEQSDLEHLEAVAKWWAKSPISKNWLDWDDPAGWPDPWELITTKNLDYSAIALGMEYTLLLNSDGRWTPDRVQLCLASDVKKTFQHLVLVVDGAKVLNATYAKVVDLTDDLMIHSRYCYEDKRHVYSG